VVRVTLTRTQWQTILEAADPPTFGEIVATLDDRELVDEDPTALIKGAIDDGVLVESDEGAFPVYSLDSADSADEEPGSRDATPTLEPEETGSQIPESEPPTIDQWSGADFGVTESGVWAPAQIERDAWMARKQSKAPYAPWTDADAPVECTHSDHDDATTCAQCRHHAGYKWGSEGSREHVHADFETARKWCRMDPELSSDLVYIQREDDPFVFVDGDDVRDPETGEIHPAFEAILEHLGVTYADISTSGAGVHAVYRGEIPLEGVGQAAFEIDTEPWGANDDAPAVEIYANKHVCIATGEHVTGSGTEVREWDEDPVEAVLVANGYDDKPEPSAASSLDLSGYQPDATETEETTDEIRDIFAALDRLDARRVADETIVHAWTDDANTSGNNRAFVPIWGRNASGTANIVDDEIWQDTGGSGYGGADVMAAIDCSDLPSYDERTQPRDLTGADWWRAIEHLRELGFGIPEYDGSDRDDDGEDYGRDPRELEATVDPRRAWDAAGRVSPDQVDGLEGDGDDFACPHCGASIDVVRAAALDSGIIDACDAALDADYPEAYRRARDEFDAPLPAYYTEADAIAEFDAVLDVIAEVTFWHLDEDAITSDITARDDDVGGEAIAALNPAWRLSESGKSVLVFESGTVWDADTERVLDALRFVALDSGLIADATEPLEGETFTTAYRVARTEYGAPLPRWEPAEGGDRASTPQLPPSEDLLDARDFDGVNGDALEQAREDVEALIGNAVADADEPTIVTALPATGKTTGTVKTAQERPLSYLAARKELQAQALEKAKRWGVDAEVLPVFSEEQISDEVLNAAVSHVRDLGKDRLRDRWSIIAAALEGENVDDVDASEIFIEEDDEDDVQLDRPTCETAEGDHGVAWALAVHVARRLGYTPQEIHRQARGLFGASLPCDHDGECPYSLGWQSVSDPDDPADLLVGSYVHAHVESVRTVYERGGDDDVERSPRPVVLDEFPGEAFSRDFGEEALDHACWLARSLREDVDDRRDMVDADLWADEWVRAWLNGEGDDHDAVSDAALALGRLGDLFEAETAAEEILDEVDDEVLEAVDVDQPLRAFRDGDLDARHAFEALGAAVDVDPERPGVGVARWVEDAVVRPLGDATDVGTTIPDADAIGIDELPVGGDLYDLIERAVDAVRAGDEVAPEMVRASVTALSGGREGCRRLAAWADDGYAHPDAHHLLEAVVTPTGSSDDGHGSGNRVSTSEWAFDPDATDGTVLDVVETGSRATSIVDRNDHGAVLHTPPSRVAAGGGDVPVVGLDATAREELWEVALGDPVATDDIHETPGERAAFLEDALDLRVLQASDRARFYEGDPSSKDTDGDVALLEAIAEEYAGIEAPRERGGDPTTVGKPAAITTKGVREVLENDSRLDDVVSAIENYGNVKGSNELGQHRLAAILGCQHFGDAAIERFAALAGQEVDTDRDRGRGEGLEYGNDLADAYLQHMTEDQTMQAILRFARGDSGATVVARTAALRDDLPVVGRGQVVETWSETARAIAKQWRRLGGEFSTSDIADAVDVSRRQVRRVLAELVEAGYLCRVDTGATRENTYEPAATPRAGEVDLPDRVSVVSAGRSDSNQYYTWNVRVQRSDQGMITPEAVRAAETAAGPPAPATVEGSPPPE
jgi:hypothetical protein